jgi:predicted metalloprotease with PDZ domain
LSSTAAESAGLAPQDELLAINGFRVTDNEKLQLLLDKARSDGKTLEILASRLDRVFSTKIKWKAHQGIGVEYVKG